MSAARTAAAALALAALTGCATTQPGTAANPRDPFEAWNRKVFAFNEGLDEHLLVPLATGYRNAVPELARTGVDNVFANFADAWSALNNLLQFKLEAGLSDVMRVSVNTVLGFGGLLDIASEMGMRHHYEDFGQTLGRWGLPSGPYVVWPVLGPSALRESAALPLDRYALPAAWVDADGAQLGLTALQIVHKRADLLRATRLIDDIALDKYVFVRDGYLQRRRSLVYDGDPPPLPEDDEADDTPADEAVSRGADAPAAPASAPAR
jgi:phospholipid-binding lipoprotein MlaA